MYNAGKDMLHIYNYGSNIEAIFPKLGRRIRKLMINNMLYQYKNNKKVIHN